VVGGGVGREGFKHQAIVGGYGASTVSTP
jgi:hypothetical protein